MSTTTVTCRSCHRTIGRSRRVSWALPPSIRLEPGIVARYHDQPSVGIVLVCSCGKERTWEGGVILRAPPARIH